jgi:F0F1-type ATP synthase membrane subunit b/b'
VTLEDLNKQEAAAIAAEKVAEAKKVADHCSSEAKANGESLTSTPLQRIQALKNKLKKQVEEGNNNYLSFYSANNCNEYSIVKK